MVPKDTQNMCDVTNDLGPVGIPKNTRKPQISVTRGLENPGNFSGPKSLLKSKSQEKNADPCLQTKQRDFKSSTHWSLVTKYVALAWLL